MRQPQQLDGKVKEPLSARARHNRTSGRTETETVTDHNPAGE
jgi:hypothetical protein